MNDIELRQRVLLELERVYDQFQRRHHGCPAHRLLAQLAAPTRSLRT